MRNEANTRPISPKLRTAEKSSYLQGTQFELQVRWTVIVHEESKGILMLRAAVTTQSASTRGTTSRATQQRREEEPKAIGNEISG